MLDSPRISPGLPSFTSGPLSGIRFLVAPCRNDCARSKSPCVAVDFPAALKPVSSVRGGVGSLSFSKHLRFSMYKELITTLPRLLLSLQVQSVYVLGACCLLSMLLNA
ncbi:hypothetical protein D3C77_585880 [compost metagenome]